MPRDLELERRVQAPGLSQGLSLSLLLGNSSREQESKVKGSRAFDIHRHATLVRSLSLSSFETMALVHASTDNDSRSLSLSLSFSSSSPGHRGRVKPSGLLAPHVLWGFRVCVKGLFEYREFTRYL